MNITAFLEYANAELRAIKHPFTDSTLLVKDVGIAVWIIDYVLHRGSGPHEALAENFYQALVDYLDTPRHQKAIIRGAIDNLATQFETFLRTTIRTVLQDKDILLYDRYSKSRGKLSQSGYLPDFLKHLCGIEAKFGESKGSYWETRPVQDAIYGVCFRHQQRGKHEARDYPLPKLESLASQVIGSYILFAEWLTQNSDLKEIAIERMEFARNEALMYWPEILDHQLEQAHIYPYEQDLLEIKEKLIDKASQLVKRAKQYREHGISQSDDVTEFYQDVESLAEEYEGLISDSNMRDYGREMEAQRYL